jgi:hypothetical protein
VQAPPYFAGYYFGDCSVLDTDPTSDFVSADVDLTSLAFIEQHDPLFFALDIEQLWAFSVEHSLDDFASTAHLSEEDFLLAVDFIEQQEAFSDFAAVLVVPVPPPANARVETAKSVATTAANTRLFIADSIDGSDVRVYA